MARKNTKRHVRFVTPKGHDVLVLLAASIGQMRLFSSTEGVTAAEQVARSIVDSCIAPDRNLKELRDAFME